MTQLLSPDDLPNSFDYPKPFIRVVELGLTNLEPWRILQGNELYRRQMGVAGRYPDRTLVVFARRQDNDDIACWDLRAGGVAIIHDFASPGYEQRAFIADFYGWLRTAIEDLIAFEP